MNCTRLMVVSRGLKLLRPNWRNPPPVWMRASTTALFAVPGSRSRPNWNRNSLITRLDSVDVSEPENVVVFATLLPECSWTLNGPPKPPPNCLIWDFGRLAAGAVKMGVFEFNDWSRNYSKALRCQLFVPDFVTTLITAPPARPNSAEKPFWLI